MAAVNMNGLAMSGTKAKVICPFVVILVGSRRFATDAAAEGRSRSGENAKSQMSFD
jgi:hypothetical protein